MAPKCDFHIHSYLSTCPSATAAMTLKTIVQECEALGHAELGIADHVNHPSHVAVNARLAAEIAQLRSPVTVFLGAEDNFIPELGGHMITPEMKKQYGYQYIIGTHHNVYVPKECTDLELIVRTQHEHHLQTCRNPATDVLAHPYRYLKGTLARCGRAPSDLVAAMPEQFLRELGGTARDTGTAIELNASSFLVKRPLQPVDLNGYIYFLQTLVGEGAKLALGSDAHCPRDLANIKLAWDLVDQLNLRPEQVWRPGNN